MADEQQTEKETATPIRHPEIIEEGPTLPMVLTEDIVAQFESGIAVYKRFVAAAYRLTRETHWIDHGREGNPKYALQAPGAEALMNPLGISYGEPHIWKEDTRDDKGTFYIYWCEGIMESRTLGRKGYYYGYCDSRDKFFNSRPGWTPETGHGDIKKSAYSNWLVNGVTRIAGLRDPDPDILKAAGLDSTKIQRIDYSGANRSATSGTDIISDSQVKRLLAITKNKGLPEQKLFDYLLKTFDYIKKDPAKADLWHLAAQIKKRDYESICKRVEEYQAPAEKEQTPEPGSLG
jgi:hypothetical protein